MMTRDLFAKHVRIPAGSIKAIETGLYEMSPEVAMRVSLATGVDPDSLMRGDKQLLDVRGLPFTQASKKPQPLSGAKELGKSMSLLFQAVLAAAEEKNVVMQLNFLLNVWLSKNVPALGISKKVFEQLERIADRLDPDFSVPDALLPTETKAKQRWLAARQKLEDELEAEMAGLMWEDLRADKEFQSLSPSEQEDFASDYKMRIEKPAEARKADDRIQLKIKEVGQRFYDKFLASLESATEEHKMEVSSAIYGLAEPMTQFRQRYRRRALERIAARGKAQ
jgi:hypothetical protein